MRPHPRIRKTVKWGGAVVCAVLLAVWVTSVWHAFDVWERGRWALWVSKGRVELGYHSLPSFSSKRPGVVRMILSPGPQANGKPIPGEFLGARWNFERYSAARIRVPGRPDEKWTVPLWTPAILMVGLTSIPWVLDTLARRRAKLGACPKCSYSRTGLAPSAACPECGSPAPVAASAPIKGS